jgi:hypothetical protein
MAEMQKNAQQAHNEVLELISSLSGEVSYEGASPVSITSDLSTLVVTFCGLKDQKHVFWIS